MPYKAISFITAWNLSNNSAFGILNAISTTDSIFLSFLILLGAEYYEYKYKTH